MQELSYWAKTTADGEPGVDVFHHMSNVGYVALEISKHYTHLLELFELQPKQVVVLAALHDIGKISPWFQCKCQKWIEKNHLEQQAYSNYWSSKDENYYRDKNHSKVSQYALEQIFHQTFGNYVGNYLASAIASHHGQLLFANSRPRPGEGMEEWQDVREKTAQKLFEKFIEPPIVKGKNSVLWYVAGLTSVADWIGSDEEFFPSDVNLKECEIKERARKAIDKIQLITPRVKKDLTFHQIFGFDSNKMQQKALSKIQRPGLYIIEAPMGMGKTEAALGVSYHLIKNGYANGIYFALPTQTTSNRIYIRFQKFIQQISEGQNLIKLIHGNSFLVEDDLKLPEYSESSLYEKEEEETKNNARNWFSSSKRALIAPYGVGTIDQALLGVVAAKHFFVRQFALAGKVVILDEVHSYDVYTSTLINELCHSLIEIGSTVIILSATLTAARRNELLGGEHKEDNQKEYPLITGKASDGEMIPPTPATPPPEKKVWIVFKDKSELLDLAISKASQGVCVLWVCDTVDAAQKTYDSLSEKNDGRIKMGLLHSRFPFFRRNILEEDWINYLGKNNENRQGSILVSTQIVEQSVDIDADLLITELAPMDMILQRLGRLWRHTRTDRKIEKAECYIVNENISLEETKESDASTIKHGFGSKAYVYHPYVLLNSWKVLSEYDGQCITIPTMIRHLLESTYSDHEDHYTGWDQLYKDLCEKRDKMKGRALKNSNVWQLALEDEEGVQTRLMPQRNIICMVVEDQGDKWKLLDGSRVEKKDNRFNLTKAKKLQKNLIKIPEWVFTEKRIHGTNEFKKYLHKECVKAFMGEDGTLQFEREKLKKDVEEISYTPEFGVRIKRRV